MLYFLVIKFVIIVVIVEVLIIWEFCIEVEDIILCSYMSGYIIIDLVGCYLFEGCEVVFEGIVVI